MSQTATTSNKKQNFLSSNYNTMNEESVSTDDDKSPPVSPRQPNIHSKTTTNNNNANHVAIDIPVKKKKPKHFLESSIPIQIQDYEDVFSRFDDRSYSVRDLSMDFVEECAKKLKLTPSHRTRLVLLIDEDKRRLDLEKIIKIRLHEFFTSQKRSTRLELFCWYMYGFSWIFFGFFVMTIVAYFNYYYNDNQSNVAYHMFNNVAAPIGWFILWSGLDIILFRAGDKKGAVRFNRKMATMKVKFANDPHL